MPNGSIKLVEGGLAKVEVAGEHQDDFAKAKGANTYDAELIKTKQVKGSLGTSY